ncbi:Putative Competence protein ComGF [Ornithinibacillus halophilus]|uniref:Putative Competence protein ComGF n=2 Tax=Ornithinibacillus halophilus TaxID=930117 RepID=A0A1M5D1L6_9BACI|nr:Putative Competence protein ComGF [Ornithinibacillus halophilus]
MDYLKAENGFSMVSALFTLSILLTTLPILAFAIQSTQFHSKYDELSVQQFFIILQKEVSLSTYAEVDDHSIILESMKRDTANIHQYQNSVRRKLNNKGHEIYIRDIKDFSLIPYEWGVKVNITTLQGEEHEKIISYYQ